jgi:pectate lyase C
VLGGLFLTVPAQGRAGQGAAPDTAAPAGNAAASTAPDDAARAADTAKPSGAADATKAVGHAAGSGAAQAGASAAAAGSGAAQAGASTAGAGATTAPDAGTSDAGERAPDAEAVGCNGDPLVVLRGYAPADEDLAGDYEKYLTEELGTLSCAMQGTGTARTLTQTIFVPANAIYDGKGETLIADAAAMRCDTTEGEQAESQRPFFLLAPGAQLKNVTITYPGCEGVHMMGDNVLDHIVWEDAGEDAASVRSYFPGGKITISHSEGHKAADKMFQFNAPCDVRIEDFHGSDMGKLVRQNGGSEFELRIDLNQVTLTAVVSAVVQSDSPLCFVRYHALSYMFKGSGDKSDRVFRDLPPANVTEY